MVPFQLVKVLSSPSARPYEHASGIQVRRGLLPNSHVRSKVSYLRLSLSRPSPIPRGAESCAGFLLPSRLACRDCELMTRQCRTVQRGQMEGNSWWIAELECARTRGGARREDQDAKARKSKWHAGGSQPCACVGASAAYQPCVTPSASQCWSRGILGTWRDIEDTSIVDVDLTQYHCHRPFLPLFSHCSTEGRHRGMKLLQRDDYSALTISERPRGEVPAQA